MNDIEKIEKLIYQEFETVPFHNLFMLNNQNIFASHLGGTCSDKVLHFREVLKNESINARLHSSFINGYECHRMLSVVVEQQKYFIDVGSGWASTKLFPTFKPVEYSVFGMSFKTEIQQNHILVYHRTDKEYKLMTIIALAEKAEAEILRDINQRFVNKSIYPFQNSLRFSKIIGNDFYFLKANRLRKYNEKEITEKILTLEEIFELIAYTFQFDVSSLRYY
jgi:asparagine synthase (glutamine-hydrolysing)